MFGVSFPIVEVGKESSEHPSADRSDVPSDVNSIAEAEKLTAKITSEVIGETVGKLFMGPAGMLIGAELGGKMGVEIGDLIEESFLPESSANKPQPPERNHQQNNKRGK